MIPFNKPFLTGRESTYIEQALASGHLSGDGAFTKRCHQILQQQTGCAKALLTHSCTAALEMAALLLDLEPGDEVIMPSFTFVSTANAFALRRAVPVFVDIRDDTLNIDEQKIEAAITARTRAIAVVHYAGVSCAMDEILQIAKRHGLAVIADTAQGVGSTYRGRPLGSVGELNALSFHETKNVIAGEGGALIVNDARYAERAEVLREKGTNRSAFFRGQIDKYTWVDIGSSYLPSEVIAALLCAQLEETESLTARRLALWSQYHSAFEGLEHAGHLRRPFIPADCGHNAHMYHLRLPSLAARQEFIASLKTQGVSAVFHYVPLHSAPAGRRFGRTPGEMPVTDLVGDTLVRLPLWVGLESRIDEVISAVHHAVATSVLSPGSA